MRDFGSVVKQLQSETAQGFPIEFRGEVHSLSTGFLGGSSKQFLGILGFVPGQAKHPSPRLDRNRPSPSCVAVDPDLQLATLVIVFLYSSICYFCNPPDISSVDCASLPSSSSFVDTPHTFSAALPHCCIACLKLPILLGSPPQPRLQHHYIHPHSDKHALFVNACSCASCAGSGAGAGPAGRQDQRLDKSGAVLCLLCRAFSPIAYGCWCRKGCRACRTRPDAG